MCYPQTTDSAQPVIAPLALQLALVQLVDSKLASGQRFSAWQIAKELQVAHPTQTIPHAEAKRSVHYLMQQEAEFGRVAIDYSGAWRVYGPVATTPDTVLLMDPTLVGALDGAGQMDVQATDTILVMTRAE